MLTARQENAMDIFHATAGTWAASEDGATLGAAYADVLGPSIVSSGLTSLDDEGDLEVTPAVVWVVSAAAVCILLILILTHM